MGIRITILCENLIGQMVGVGEHGFSAFIETEQGNYLLDTGGGGSILQNALTFDKNLRSVKKIFLSHGHNDHTGGLPHVLKLRGKVDIHGHPLAFTDRFSIFKEKEREIRRFAGMVYKRSYLEFLGAKFVLNTDFTEVDKGLYLTGEVPRETSFEKGDPRLFREVEGRLLPDLLPDDQSLILETEKGLVLVLGCAHSGMINIMNHVMQKMKKDHFYAVLGGTHLDFLTPEQLEQSIAYLKKLNVRRIGVSHCTGLRAASRLQQEFGERYHYGYVGSVLEI
jgi:7,8-dihydropterin-6-yl-methyl-4-(beta-D-ribofuranosyl)aminobenzene 5'-phosphate synthase